MGRERDEQRNREAARHGFSQVASEDNVTTTSSDDTAQQQALQVQLNNLRTETQNSRDTYSGDLVTVRSCLDQLGENSPIANVYSDKIRPMLGITTYYDNYDSAIREINNTHI